MYAVMDGHAGISCSNFAIALATKDNQHIFIPQGKGEVQFKSSKNRLRVHFRDDTKTKQT